MRRKVILILLLYAVILCYNVTPVVIADANGYDVTLTLPDTCVIGTDLLIQGTATGGETVDIANGDIMVAVDIPIAEDGRFIKKIALDVETMVIVIKAYVNGPKDRDGNPVEVKVGERIPESSGIFDNGNIQVIMTAPTLSAEQSTSNVARNGTYSITGIAPGSDCVDIVLIGPKGSYGVGTDGGYGITVYYVPVSKTNHTFSKTITIDKNADEGRYIALILSPGLDQEYGYGCFFIYDKKVAEWEKKEDRIADLISSAIFDLKTQPEALDLMTSKTINATGCDDLSQSTSFYVGNETEAFVPPRTSLEVEQLALIAAKGDNYHVSGTCYGSDFVNIISISPKGGPGNATSGAKPGFNISTVHLKNHSFSKMFPLDKCADFGGYEILVLSPGRNGVYDGIGTSDLKNGVSNKYGGYEHLVNYKTQKELVAIIKDATIEAAGSDDLIQELRVTIESPYIHLEEIEDVLIGDTLEIKGTTNREPGTKIRITARCDLLELPVSIEEVKWPTPDEGVFSATIDTDEAVGGTYVVDAEDGVSYECVDVNIVETIPTALLTIPNMTIGIGTADRSYPLLNPALSETPTSSPTSTPLPEIEKINGSINDFILFIKKDIRWAISITIAIFILMIGLTNIRLEYEKKKKEHQKQLINKNILFQWDAPVHKEEKIFLYQKIKQKLKGFVYCMKNYLLSLRILSWVMIILSIMSIVDYIFVFFELQYVHLGVLVSALGITASILIFENKRVGVILALVWSALQILTIQIDSFCFNFIQFLDLRFYFSIDDANFGINIFAIILFCLFFIKREELDIQ
ncbi:hypothetical protein C5S53_15230 [Methanophagales archaeon]|nr:hypothetical protein C5S53_15230 [Methanophagales archaeon]